MLDCFVIFNLFLHFFIVTPYVSLFLCIMSLYAFGFVQFQYCPVGGFTCLWSGNGLPVFLTCMALVIFRCVLLPAGAYKFLTVNLGCCLHLSRYTVCIISFMQLCILDYFVWCKYTLEYYCNGPVELNYSTDKWPMNALIICLARFQPPHGL